MTRVAAVFFVLPVGIALAAGSACAQQSKQQAPSKPLTVEAIYAHGSLIGHPPTQLTWSPDGKHLTYMDGGQLIDLDPGTGKPHVLVSRAKMAPLDEAGGTEEDRDHRSRYHMASYFWSPDSKSLLFDSNGRLWFFDLHSGTGVQVGSTGAAAGDDPKFSPNGEEVSFLRNHGIEVIRVRGTAAPPVQVATAPNPESGQSVLNGGVDWVYEEELETRSNYFWSPDSKYIAYLQMNETNVPQYPITDWIPVHATVEMQRYPQPGDSNPELHLGVVSAHGGKTEWIRLPFHQGDDYVPRFGWVNAKTLWVEVLTRNHKHRYIFFADIANGEVRRELEINDDKFVDDNYDVFVEGGSIVFAGWASGHNHLYLYSYEEESGGCACQAGSATDGWRF